MLKSLVTFAVKLVTVSALQISSYRRGAVNINRLSDRVVGEDQIYLQCPYIISRNNRFNFRAHVNVWGYQIVNADGSKGDASFMIHIDELSQNDNTLQIEVKEGRVRSQCYNPVTETVVGTFNYADTAGTGTSKVIFQDELNPTTLDFYTKKREIDGRTFNRIWLEFKANDSDGVLQEMGCCTLRKVPAESFIQDF